MKAYNKKKKPKHWTIPKWKSQQPLDYFSLITICTKRQSGDILRYFNFKTSKFFRYKRKKKLHLVDSMIKEKN